VRVKPLSDSEPKVSWRLNDLLRAGQRARAFAAVTWSSPEDQGSKAFKQWHPNRLPSIEIQDVSESDDLGDKEREEVAANPMVAEEELQQAKKDAYDDGFSKGRAEAELNYSEAKQALIDLTKNIRKNQENSSEFFVPLKKLAIHLAEELVRGELNLSAEVIDRLVKAALDDLEAYSEETVIVNLHPIDMEKLQPHWDSEFAHLELRGDPQLSQGSVIVTMGDTAIEDLLENRLQLLAEDLIKPIRHSGSDKTSTNAIVKAEAVKAVFEQDRSVGGLIEPERSSSELSDESLKNTQGIDIDDETAADD
jgi:flagellar biosynthesis/type III secretory pathway protein FliH